MHHFFGIVSWKSKYNIEFKGLKEGLHNFDFRIDDTFFRHFEESLVDNGDIKIKVILEKRSAFLKIRFKIKGWLELTCDRCLDNYQQKVKGETEFFVKFGEKKFEEGENVIWVLPDEHFIGLTQAIYEYVSSNINEFRSMIYSGKTARIRKALCLDREKYDDVWEKVLDMLLECVATDNFGHNTLEQGIRMFTQFYNRGRTHRSLVKVKDPLEVEK